MERKVVAGMGIQSLMDLLQGRPDEEHEKIIGQVSDMTNNRLKEISGDNLLARKYVQDIWRRIMDGLTKGKHAVPTDEQTTIQILRVIADSFELRNRLHDELHKAQEARSKETTGPRPVDKDVQ